MLQRRVTTVCETSWGRWLREQLDPNATVVFLTPGAAVLMAVPGAGGLNLVEPAERLHRRISSLAGPLTDIFVQAGVLYDPLTWWGSQIASRSVSGTPLPMNAAMALVACDEMDKPGWDGHLVFVCRSAALCRVIENEARKRSIDAAFFRDRATVMAAFKLWIRPFGKAVEFCVGSVSRWVHVRMTGCKLPRAGTRISLIRSWCTPSNISPDGTFTDRNFGDLPSRLEAAGHDVWTTPCLLRVDTPFSEILRRMGRSRTRFLHVERAVRLGDIFRQAYRGFLESQFRFEKCLVEGCDLGPIFRESVRQCATTPELMTFNLIHAAFRRLASKGCQVERFFYPMENNPFEKLPILGMRAFQPAGKSYGFQHSAWFKYQYSMQLVPGEVTTHPIPDRILCTGSRYMEIMRRCGFPEERLQIAPSYRFAYTINAAPTEATKAPVSGILVLPGFNADHANEMLWKTLRAVARLDQPVPVFVKPHPTSDLAAMHAIMKSRSDIPCSIVEGSAMDWVEKSAMVVDSGGSIAALETILRGKPLLRLVPGSSYFFDPLWEDYPIPLAFDEAQLADNIINVLQGNVDHRRLAELVEIVRVGYFEPDRGQIPI